LRLFNYLKKNNINCQVHYVPVYWHLYYQKFPSGKGYKKGLCPKAENFYLRELSLPLYPLLKSKEVDCVINKIFEFLKNEKE
jgi:dTDP-4-amino-4,6-dideoxygalactose transaminase